MTFFKFLLPVVFSFSSREECVVGPGIVGLSRNASLFVSESLILSLLGLTEPAEEGGAESLYALLSALYVCAFLFGFLACLDLRPSLAGSLVGLEEKSWGGASSPGPPISNPLARKASSFRQTW